MAFQQAIPHADEPKVPALDGTIEIISRNVKGNASDEFQYGRIEPDQIRLLLLLPSSQGPDLEGSLMVSEFPEISLSHFDALSYTWGCPDPTATIKINDRKLQITPNLAAALQQFRHESMVEVLWIDAICINQADDEEKGHQIQLMRFIYEQARIVRTWLGEHDESSKSAMGILRVMEHMNPGEDWLLSFCTSVQNREVLGALDSLFKRPYWKRVWVLQELVCARRALVHCGDSFVGWDVVMTFQKWLQVLENRTWYPIVDPDVQLKIQHCGEIMFISSTKNLRQRAKAEEWSTNDRLTSLHDLLMGMSHHQATNPKDRIYAILGIVEDISLQNSRFPIDYTLKDEQVYIDIAKWITIISGDLRILLSHRHEQAARSRYIIPSWCPDWSLEPKVNSLFSISQQAGREFCAGGRENSPPRFRQDDALIASGTVVDTIDTLTGVFKWENIWWYQFVALTKGNARRFLDTSLHGDQGLRFPLAGSYSRSEQDKINKWANVSTMGDPSVPAALVSGESILSSTFQRALLQDMVGRVPHILNDTFVILGLESFWRTLVAGGVENNDDMDSLNSKFRVLMGWEKAPNVAGKTETEVRLQYTLPFRRHAAAAASKRQFSIGHSGRFGLAPPDAREGDFVCVLSGASVPILLRPVGNHFVVVGETYLHGFMNGEAIAELERGNLERRDFILH